MCLLLLQYCIIIEIIYNTKHFKLTSLVIGTYIHVYKICTPFESRSVKKEGLGGVITECYIMFPCCVIMDIYMVEVQQ